MVGAVFPPKSFTVYYPLLLITPYNPRIPVELLGIVLPCPSSMFPTPQCWALVTWAFPSFPRYHTLSHHWASHMLFLRLENVSSSYLLSRQKKCYNWVPLAQMSPYPFSPTPSKSKGGGDPEVGEYLLLLRMSAQVLLS